MLFRIFRYPPASELGERSDDGVQEHTDYGLLTILAQDGTPGLEVHAQRVGSTCPLIPTYSSSTSATCSIG